MVADTQFIDAIDKMHAYYTQAFSNLMIITFGIIAFVGVVLPIVVSLIQNRQLKRENETLRRDLKKEIEEIASKEVEKIEIAMEEKSKSIDEMVEEKLSELKKLLEASAEESRGSIFHLQGNSGVSNKDYDEAAVSYSVATRAYLTAKNMADVRVVATLLHHDCLRHLDSEAFAHSNRIKNAVEEALEDLRAGNADGRHTDLIENIENSLSLAEKREPRKNVQGENA